MAAIKTEDLAKVITEEMQKFAGATDEVVAKAVKKVSKETVQRLKDTSPVMTGSYASSWGVDNINSGTRHRTISVIHAGSGGGGEYRLTHLLEHGHAVVRGGRVVGHAKAYPHIEAAEQAAINSLMEEIQKGVENI